MFLSDNPLLQGAYGMSNQDPRGTLKPIYTPIFTHLIRSSLLCMYTRNRYIHLNVPTTVSFSCIWTSFNQSEAMHCSPSRPRQTARWPVRNTHTSTRCTERRVVQLPVVRRDSRIGDRLRASETNIFHGKAIQS